MSRIQQVHRATSGCVTHTPLDWDILQLFSNTRRGSPIYDHTLNLAEDWISWQGDHLGAAAYMINLAGMTDILRRTRQDQNGTTIWSVPAWEGPAWPEDVLFYKATTYTSTYHWFSDEPGHILRSSLPVQAHDMQHLEEYKSKSVLVLQTCHIQEASKIRYHLLKIKADLQEMLKWHKNISWEVTLAFKSKKLYQRAIRKSSSLFPKIPNMHWIIVYAPKRFNKYEFVKPHIGKFLATTMFC